MFTAGLSDARACISPLGCAGTSGLIRMLSRGRQSRGASKCGTPRGAYGRTSGGSLWAGFTFRVSVRAWNLGLGTAIELFPYLLIPTTQRHFQAQGRGCGWRESGRRFFGNPAALCSPSEEPSASCSSNENEWRDLNLDIKWILLYFNSLESVDLWRDSAGALVV